MKWLVILVIGAAWLDMTAPGLAIRYRFGLEGYAKMVSSEFPAAKKLTEQNLAFQSGGTVNVFITKSEDDFREVQKGAPEWATATADPGHNAIYLKPLRDMSPNSLAETFRHELAHILLNRRLNGHRAPRWFDEGMAVLTSGELSFSRYQALAQIVWSGRFMPFEQFDFGFPSNSADAQVAYAQSESFVSYLMDTLGPDDFKKLLDKAASGEDFYQALHDLTGVPFKQLETNWAYQIHRKYNIVSIVFGSTSLWFLVTLLFLFAYLTRKRRLRERARHLELESGYFPYQEPENPEDPEDEKEEEKNEGYNDEGGEKKWH